MGETGVEDLHLSKAMRHIDHSFGFMLRLCIWIYFQIQHDTLLCTRLVKILYYGTQLITSRSKKRSTMHESCEIRWISVFPCHVINLNSNCFSQEKLWMYKLRLGASKDCPLDSECYLCFCQPEDWQTFCLEEWKRYCQVNVQGKSSVFKADNATFFYCRKLILNSVSEIIMLVVLSRSYQLCAQTAGQAAPCASLMTETLICTTMTVTPRFLY